eukprot:1675369-Rhodomonas_salina.2
MDGCVHLILPCASRRERGFTWAGGGAERSSAAAKACQRRCQYRALHSKRVGAYTSTAHRVANA